MLYSFLLSAWRNLTHNRWFSLLNIVGLAIGTAASMLIFDYLKTELDYDQAIPDSEQIYRLYDAYPEGSQANLVPGIAPMLKEQLPGIENLARILPANGIITDKDFKFDPAYYGESNEVFYADPDFPAILGLIRIAGRLPLDKPNTTILNVDQATEWFGGSEQAVGKFVTFKDQFAEIDYQVVGVFEDLPFATHINPEMLLAHHTLIPTRFGWDDLNGFGWGAFFYYLKVKEGVSTAAMEEVIAANRKMMFPEEHNPGRLSFQPIEEVHFDNQFSYDIATSANTDQVLIMAGLGIFILIIAWLNYINMATARSIDRAREVGVRKSVGASRTQLIAQFLLESALINFLAVALSILLVDLSIDYFHEITGHQPDISYWKQGWFWIVTIALWLGGTLASGLYPAFFLSGFDVTRVLKGDASGSAGRPRLRQVLVMVQFVLSMILLSGAYSVYQQMNFIEGQHASLNTSHKVVVQGPSILPDSTANEKLTLFNQALTSNSEIKGISLTSSLPGIGYNYGNGGVRLSAFPESKAISCEIWYGDDEFVSLYGIEVVAGRNFSIDQDHGKDVILVNEAAARSLGFSDPQDILGQMVEIEGTQRVVGVIKDYHHESLHAPIRASIFLYKSGFGSWYTVDVHGNHIAETVDEIDSTFRALFPGNPSRIFLYEELYARMYASEKDFGKTVGIFSGLAILVACLGLIGLALFSAKKRSREIGIRKVLGATDREVILLLSKELLVLVGLAVLIALPLCWMAITTWLEQFAFKVPMSITIFMIPGLLLLVIAWLSVSWQTWLSARANPINSLRHE